MSIFAPVLQSAQDSSGAYSRNSFVATLPAGVQEGDLLICEAGFSAMNVNLGPITMSAGWTSIIASGNTSLDHYMAVFYKVAGPSETNPTVISAAADQSYVMQGSARISRINNYKSPPEFKTNIQNTGSTLSASIAIQIVNSTAQNSLVMIGASNAEQASTPYTLPATYTPNISNYSVGNGTEGVRRVTSHYSQSGAGNNEGGSIVPAVSSKMITWTLSIAGGEAPRLSQFSMHREGVWTPEISSRSGGNPTATNKGYWTRIGNQVTAWATVAYTGLSGNATTEVVIAGLPFVARGSDIIYGGSYIPTNGQQANSVNLAAGYGVVAVRNIQIALGGGSKEMKLMSYIGTNDTYLGAPNSIYYSKFEHFSSSCSFCLCIHYLTDDP